MGAFVPQGGILRRQGGNISPLGSPSGGFYYTGGLRSFRTLRDFKLHFLPRAKRPESFTLNSGIVDENVVSPRLFDKSIPFLRVEPLYKPFCQNETLLCKTDLILFLLALSPYTAQATLFAKRDTKIGFLCQDFCIPGRRVVRYTPKRVRSPPRTVTPPILS